jgi:hypothetical protein
MVIPLIYYQYELAHFKGNMGHDATSDVSNWVILEQVLARWLRLVAFMKAMNLLHRAMRTV